MGRGSGGHGIKQKVGERQGMGEKDRAYSVKVEPAEEVRGIATLPMFLQGMGQGCKGSRPQRGPCLLLPRIDGTERHQDMQRDTEPKGQRVGLLQDSLQLLSSFSPTTPSTCRLP